jgi:hypothetical protein
MVHSGDIVDPGPWRCGAFGLVWTGDISNHHGITPPGFCPGPHLRTNEAPRGAHLGDPVLYHLGDESGSVLGVVIAVAAHDGDCDIDLGDDAPALDVKMGQGPHTYEPLDFSPDWTIVYCPSCRRRNVSTHLACIKCGTVLSGRSVDQGEERRG